MIIPLVALPGAFDAILEEIRGQLGALLLVVVGIGAISIRVPLRRSLKLGSEGLGTGLARHGRIQVAVVGRACTTRCARPLGPGWRRAPGTIATRLSRSSEVLMGKLVCQASVRVVAGAGGVGAVAALSKVRVVRGHSLALPLVTSTVLLLLLLRLLRWLKVALWLLAVPVWLLFLGLLDGRNTRLGLLVCSRRIDGLGEGGGSSRIGSVGGTT